MRIPPQRLRYSLPWVAILFITAGFHFYRGVPVDGWIFLVAGVVLGADVAVRSGGARHAAALHATVPSAMQAKPVRRWIWTAVALALAVLTVAVAVLAPTDSAGIPAVVALVGAVMLLLSWPDPVPDPAPDPVETGAIPRTGPAGEVSRREDGSRQGAARRAPVSVRRAAWWWSGVVLFLCIWELGTYFIDKFAPADSETFPPLTDLLQPLFDSDASRWLMMVVWLAACAALIRVVRRP